MMSLEALDEFQYSKVSAGGRKAGRRSVDVRGMAACGEIGISGQILTARYAVLENR